MRLHAYISGSLGFRRASQNHAISNPSVLVLDLAKFYCTNHFNPQATPNSPVKSNSEKAKMSTRSSGKLRSKIRSTLLSIFDNQLHIWAKPSAKCRIFPILLTKFRPVISKIFDLQSSFVYANVECHFGWMSRTRNAVCVCNGFWNTWPNTTGEREGEC